MLKPKISNILLFIFLKYLFFYIFLMFKNDNYALISFGNLNSFQDLFYYLFLFLTLPIFFSIILIIPIYFILKTKKIYLFFLSMLVVLLFEYFLYTYLASQANFWNGVFNGVFSVIFLCLFFYKSIKHNLIKLNNVKD